ncbi:MAG: hypothetical protein E7051_03055 [Lentisphaerae bacterium]|nr:hypothetical protein [Lentisphaerota bacterium]
MKIFFTICSICLFCSHLILHAIEPVFELRIGKECKVLIPNISAVNQKIVFNGGVMQISNDRIGVFNRHKIIFSSNRKEPQLLEIAAVATGKLDGKTGFFDGNKEHALNKCKLERKTHLETFPLPCVWNEQKGFAIGFVPDTDLSYFSSAAKRKDEKVSLSLAARIVLDDRKNQEVTFLSVDFFPEFKWANAIQLYYDTFPDSFKPISGIDERIYGIGGYHGGAHLQRMLQLQSSRYSHLDWQWCFHTRDGGDDWYTAGADFSTKKVARYYGIGKPKMCSKQEFAEVTKKEFEIGSRSCAELFYILVTDVHNRQAEKFPETIHGPSYMCNPKFAKACFAPGSPLFDVLVKQLQQITQEYNISGFAFDMANSSYRFTTKSQMDYAIGRAFDEKGVIYTCDTLAENAFADAVHSMKRGKLPMAVYMNMALSDFSAFTTFKADAIMFEGNPDTNLAAILPLRLMAGRKPMTFWASVDDQRRNTGIRWNQADAKELKGIHHGLASYILFKSLQFGISPMNWAIYYDDFKFFNPWVNTIIALKKAGYQPITAVRGSGSEKLWIGRFGSGKNTLITISNPQRESVKADLEFVTSYFGGKNYIFIPSADGKIVQKVQKKRTIFQHEFASKEIMVLRAVEIQDIDNEADVTISVSGNKVEIASDKILRMQGVRQNLNGTLLFRTEPESVLDNSSFKLKSDKAVLYFEPTTSRFGDVNKIRNLFSSIYHAEHGSDRRCETIAMMAGMYRPHLAGVKARGGVPGKVEPGFIDAKYAVPDIAIYAPGKAPSDKILFIGTLDDLPELAVKLDQNERKIITVQQGGFIKIIGDNSLWIGGNTPQEVYSAGIEFFNILDKNPLPLSSEKQNIIFNGDDIKTWEKGKIVTNGKILTAPVPFTIVGKSIPVESGKVYTLSGDFRMPDNSNFKHFFFGVEALDDQGKVISHISAVPAGKYSLAKISKNAAAGATELEISDCEDWPSEVQHCALGFNAQADNSDLPNFNLSPQIKSFIREKDKIKVLLKNGLSRDVAAGTSVRLHRGGDIYIFVAANNRTLNEKFKTFSGSFSTNGKAGVHRLFPGTKAIRPVIWTWNVSKSKLEFHNVKLVSDK